MWVMLRSSISQKLEELAKRTAERMDKLELQVIQKILGYSTQMDHDWNCTIRVPVDNIEGRSFQNWVLMLLVRPRGLRMRSNVETSPANCPSPAAFIELRDLSTAERTAW